MTNYVKTTWSDRIVQKPLTYTLQNNGDGTTTLIPAEGTITQSGTPITATTLNNIENGIANALDTTGSGVVGGPVTFNSGINFPLLQGIHFQVAGRAGETTIFWNANASNTYGLVFKEDGKDCCAMFGGDNAGTIQGLHENLYFRAGSPFVWADNNYFRVQFGNGSEWLNISPRTIQNPSGNGDMIIESGDGAGWAYLRSPAGRVQLASDGGVYCMNMAASGYITVFAGGFSNQSARSLKNSIEDFSETAEDIINSAKIKSFKYNIDKIDEAPRLGLIHDEAPEHVKDGKEDGIDLYKMVSVAWKAIQELSEKVSLLEAKIAELSAK